MALNVGANFKQRWLDAPQAVRQVYLDELKMVSELLTEKIELSKWQQQQALAQSRHQQAIDQAYARRKAEILTEKARRAEERKRVRQVALEQKLAEKRVQQAEIALAFAHDEAVQQQRQNEDLRDYAEWLRQQPAPNAMRFDTAKLGYSNRIDDDLRARLEIEAEYYIEQQLQQLRVQLHAAAKEEIEMIVLQQSSQ